MFATPVRILLADEDKESLAALAKGVHSHLDGLEQEVEVITCRSTTEVFRQVETLDLDAVVADVQISTMDELTLLERMQVFQPEIPVLLISDCAAYQIALQALRLGAYDLLKKPIEWDRFMVSLKSALQARQVSRIQAAIAVQQSSINPLTLLRGVKVLMVDDDRDGCEMQRMTLQAYGAKAVAVNSVDAALTALENFDPDVIVSDIRMPQRDGYDLIQEVRRRSSGSNETVPAIALTAYARNEDRAHALNTGFQLQLTKPVKPITLALTVISLLKVELF